MLTTVSTRAVDGTSSEIEPHRQPPGDAKRSVDGDGIRFIIVSIYNAVSVSHIPSVAIRSSGIVSYS